MEKESTFGYVEELILPSFLLMKQGIFPLSRMQENTAKVHQEHIQQEK